MRGFDYIDCKIIMFEVEENVFGGPPNSG